MTVPNLRCSVARAHTQDAADGADAPLLVLGPSLGTTSESWSPALPALSDGFRVLRFDLPGHGYSRTATEPFTVAELADAVIALVDSVGTRTFHYAGVSLGGAIGLQLALRHPDRLLSLTALCTGAVIADGAYWTERAATVRASGTAVMVANSARVWFAPGFLQREPDLGGATLNGLVTVDDESYALCCEALADHDVTGRLGEISTRTLCVACDNDTATPASVLQALAHGIPDARYHEISDAAHLPMLEHPDVVAELITAHAASARGVEGAGEAGGETGRLQAGMRTRRSVLGDAHVDAAVAATTAETADFQDFITRYAWGEVWMRPGLDRRSRSLLTIASLVTGGHSAELALHVRAALRNGLSRAEIGEAVLHTAVYAGVPAANTAFGVLRTVFSELDGEPGDEPDPESGD